MKNPSLRKKDLYLRYSGQVLLATSLLNKGNAFSEEERKAFNLEGLLPASIESISEQSARSYQQFNEFKDDLAKHIYLRNIQDENETLYYRLIEDHLEEMLPIIYTPTVGLACQKFSQIYRRKRGVFIAYPKRDSMDEILHNTSKEKVKIIVVTDSERILGLGDQGIGGMGIPIGKLSLYSACGGVSPAYTLPVTLDVGTNNQDLLDDPLYMGWRHKRIHGDEYFKFIDDFIQSVLRRWPKVLIQFEDFAQANATPLLKKYQDQLCCFNDDIQGTAAVTVGTLLAACFAQGSKLKDHRIVFVGAGSAACGIANQIVSHMKKDGLSEEQAREQIFLTNSKGLLTEKSENVRDFQQSFVKTTAKVGGWSSSGGRISLHELIQASRPTILVGVSGVSGLIDEAIVKTMLSECPNPIILPLSNPTSKAEALPTDVITWTQGQATVATGSPFDPIEYQGKAYPIAQCNNVYVFPGIGLGVLASGAKRVTETMFMTASETLAACSPLVTGKGPELLPKLNQIREVSREIALQVGLQAIKDGVALKVSEKDLNTAIDKNFWSPEYRPYKRISG